MTKELFHKPRPRGQGLSTREINSLRRSFAAGIAIRQAARDLHCCTRTVERYYNRFRDEKASGLFGLSRKGGTELTEREVQNLRSAWEHGEPMDKAARRLAISRNCVRQWYERFHSGEAHPNETKPAEKEKTEMPRRHYVGNFDL